MNRPGTAQHRVPLLGVLAAAAAMVASACSVASPSVPATDRAPAATASAGVASPSPTASPYPIASVEPSPAASPPELASIPAGWQSCANAYERYEIGYPAGWHTASLNPQEACRQFHPIVFTVPVDGEYPLTALNAVQTPELFDPELSGKGDPLLVRTLLREPTVVDGRRAVRFEESLTEDGMYPVGLMKYGYVIDRDGREFVVFSLALPGEVEYADWKAVVDQAVQTLRFG